MSVQEIGQSSAQQAGGWQNWGQKPGFWVLGYIFLSHLAFLCATVQPALTWPQGMPEQPPHSLPSHEQVRPRDLSTVAGNVLEWACLWVSSELVLAFRTQGQHVPSETSALPTALQKSKWF